MDAILIIVVSVGLGVWLYQKDVGGPEVHERLSTPSYAPNSWDLMRWPEGRPEIGPAIAGPLELKAQQVQEIDAALSATLADYLLIEAQHTELSIDEHGHQFARVSPMTTQLEQLENEFWTRIDPVLRDSWQQGEARRLIGPVLESSIFPFSHGLDLEIWKVGTWYEWNAEYQTSPHAVQTDRDRRVMLPDRYRRFWPEPDSESAVGAE